MSLFDTPEVPSATDTARAQTGTNVSTAVANAYLNNINQITPQGSLTYDPTGSYSWTDPSTGSAYNIPTFTSTQTYSPSQQAIFANTQVARENLGEMAKTQSSALKSQLGTPFDASKGSFNAQSYLSANPDVAASVPKAFNAQQYLANNPDVAAAAASSGQDASTFAQQHWNQYGQAEGRTGLYATMSAADWAAQHYRDTGQSEGRTGAYTNPAPAAGDTGLISGSPNAQMSFADVGGQQRSLGSYGSQMYGFGDAGNLTRSYGPGDFSADRSRVEESLYQRMDPQLQRDRSAMEARLADQGIKIGSPAYQAAMDQFNRQLTDTRLGITQTAGQEQQRMMNMAAQRAGFENAAQQQAYTQALGRGTFANEAQKQQFQQALQGGTFANQAQQQDFQQAALRGQFYNTGAAQQLTKNQVAFNAANTARNQSISEAYAKRNQPLNEISALLSGSQVSSPNWINTDNNNIATTDVAGLINNQFSQNLSAYQQQSSNFNSLMGGIFGALGGVVSDRREKEDIHQIGTVFAAGENGEKPLPIYSYAYKDDPTETRRMGPMAQDVEKIDKRAVKTHKGVKMLDRTKLGSILRV